MTGNRGRGSRFQIWVAVPVSGLVAGAGLAALTVQGLDRARDDRGADVPSAVDATDDDAEDLVADGLRVRAAVEERPTLLRPAAAVSPVTPVQPTSLMVAAVLSSPVWSSRDYEYVAAPAPVAPPAPVVVATPPAPPAPPPSQPPPSQPPTQPPTQPPVTPPVEPEEPAPEEPPVEPPPSEEPGYGTEEPPVEEPTDPPVDPPTDPVDGTATEQTTDTGSEPTPTGASLETVG
jgi:hypothetical protein